MKERTRKIFIMIVMAALIVSLMAASFAALTYGRYSGGRRDENSAYEDILDLVGETAFEVSTADELVNAINNGYSYIKVVGDDPTLVVNNNVADVVVNLVLDVNGHKIVRNSRNPLLNVRQSVSVVLVYDSSEKAEGGFYNPVGSALQTSGGTLTVGEGVYESGPSSEATQSQGEGTVSATVCSRDNNRKATSYSVQSTDQTFPKLTKKTGDVYLTADTSNSYLKADTYLIYTEEENAFVEDGTSAGDGTVLDKEQLYVNAKKDDNGTVTSADKFSPICDVASCDFYYYYPVGAPGTANSPQTYAVVYGYNDVKKLASNEKDAAKNLQDDGLVWPYAAIRSEAGNTHARGGEFYTYFGEENTHSIYSEGGTMTVGLSGESADAPTFQAIGKGVCINMAGTSGSADQTLTIENGEFSSKIGDTIKMSGGEMEVKKGSFTKDATGADENSTNNGSAISISGGTLTSSDTEDTSKPIEFNISGSYVNGIYAKGGEINIANAKFDFAKGENNQGVYNDGGTSRAHWCDFTLPGDNNYGIHSTNGTTRASDCAIKMTGEYAVGVYTTGGRALVEGGRIDVTFAENKSDGLLTSAAVSTEGGEIYLAGNLAITSHFLGVTVRQGEDTSGLLEIATDTITTTDGTTYSDIDSGNVTINTPNATGIYVNNGNLINKGTVTVTSSVGNEEGADKGWNWVNAEGNPLISFNKYNGVYVQGGSLVSEGTLNVTFTGVENESHKSYDALKIRSYAVRVEAAATGGNSEVSIAGGTISNSVGGGVYVGGGTVTLGVRDKGGPTIGTTGVSFGNENTSAGGGNWKYYENKTGGHAVEVSGGALLVYGGLYTAALGNGILVRGGNAWVLNGTFQGNDTGDYRGNYGEGNLPAGPAAYYALKLLGGSVTTFGGTFGTYTADGTTHEAGGSSAFVTGVSSQATANIFGGTFVVNGQSGFSVYENVALEFTPNKEEKVNGQTLKGSDVTVSATTTAIAIENTTEQKVSVKINGGTFESTGTDDGKRDGIWYSNPYAKLTINQPDGQKTTISAKAQHGIRLVHAPVTKGGVKITGGTITGAQHGILYVDTTDNGKVAHVDDGLLIEGGTIEGKSGAGLYFAANPWQRPDNVATNNVAIVGGTFKGVPEEKSSTLIWENSWYDKGAIGSSTTGNRMDNRDGLGEEIKLNDILKTHTGDNRVGYVQNTGYNGNNGSSIADTVSSMTELTITSGIS